MLNRLYKDLPEDREADFYQEAMQKGVKFLNAGDDSPPETSDKPRLYSFNKDAKLIYAAFSSTHGVDVQAVEMHWFRFLALFLDLGADTAFSSMCNLRKRYHDGKLSEDEKTLVAEMGDAFLVDSSDVYDQPEPDELEFIRMLPAEDQQRYWEARKR